MTMRVARLVKQGEPFEVGEADLPTPGPRDVVVKVAACHLTGSAYKIAAGITKPSLPSLPAVFGLDASGTIESVGEQVVGLSPGDRVYVDPWHTCETCHQCRRGERSLCPNAYFRGYTAPTPGGPDSIDDYPLGGLSQYLLAPDARIARVPESIDLDLAARFGYTGTSFAALLKGDCGPGSTILINGVTGMLGVAAVAIALGLGATKILGVGRNEDVLARVAALDPTRVETVTADAITHAWVRERTAGLGVDTVYDCVGGGDADALNALLPAVKPGGSAVVVGAAGGDVVQSYGAVLGYDVQVRGSIWFTSAEIDRMIAMIGAGVIDFDHVEHHRFGLDEVNDALALAGSHPGGFANVIVQPHR